MTRTAEAGLDSFPESPIRLLDAYMLEAQVERRAEEGADPESGPTFDLQVRPPETHEDDILTVRIAGKVERAFKPGYVASISCTAIGHFRTTNAPEGFNPEAFANGDGLVIVYPFLRGYIGELARMTAILFPPLPTLNVRTIARGPQPSESPPAKRASRGGQPVRGRSPAPSRRKRSKPEST